MSKPQVLCKEKMLPAITLQQYIARRLGKSGKEQVVNFLYKPFGSLSFSSFWRYWNPLFGYYLYYYFYKPISNYVSRPLAVWLTFVCSGILHDLPFQLLRIATGKPPLFTITILFSLLGVVAVAGDFFKLTFKGLPFMVRASIHALTIYWSWWIALVLTS